MKTQSIYYISLYLSERVHFNPYGFTSYVDCYVHAEDFTTAEKLAKLYFEKRYKVSVTRLKSNKAKEQDLNLYASPEQIISNKTPLVQASLF